MPECGATHILEYLFEIGPTVPLGMSSGPVPFSEIEAWQRVTGIELSPWESRVIRRLSRDYLEQSFESRDPGCEPPFDSDEVESKRRDLVALQISQIIKPKTAAKGA